MPGIFTLIRSTNIEKQIADSTFDHLMPYPNFRIKRFSDAHTLSLVSCYEEYPWQEFSFGDTKAIMEGYVYNHTKQELESILKNIATEFENGGSCSTLIKQFIDTTDGDFIVQFINHREKKALIFNDYWGRLPFFYYSDSDQFIAGREIKFFFDFLPKIAFNKMALVEFLMLEHVLGTHTMIEGVNSLDSAQIIHVDFSKKEIKVNVSRALLINYSLNKPHTNKKEAAHSLAKLFMESVGNRINTVKRDGLNIICDLSGGFDSRTVFGGIQKTEKNVTYFNSKYPGQNEEKYARDLFDHFESPGSFKSFTAATQIDLSDIESYMYKTDGSVNYYTTYLGIKHVEDYKRNTSGKNVRFSGAGGEFIRCPRKKYFHSILYGLENKLYSPITLKEACSMLDVAVADYKKNFDQRFSKFPEKTSDGQLKRFYVEYYRKYACGQSEDRERFFFWTIQPLCGTFFLKEVFHKIPLHWTGFKFYISFLENVDKRLTQVPIYKRNIDFNSKLSINSYELKYRLPIIKKKAYENINYYSPFLLKAYRKLKKKREQTVSNPYSEQIVKYYDKLNNTKSIININELNHIADVGQLDSPLRAVSLFMYFSSLEKRFREKVSV